ncbi:hypothetical protein G9A89_001991 [Geosiphon pyriformis]|nr:hypothetical protein G9A89_001991 [Geosiphon pyriformis]
MVKKTKSSEKWGQLLASAIVTPNLFVVFNEILDEISINWANQMETESSSPLVFGATSGGAWETITSYQRFAGWVASILVSDATFKIKLAHVKTVFQSIHGFLGAKSVSKDNVKLFCVEFASQQSLETAFLVELTSSVHLATLKIAKSLVVFESGSFSAAVALHDVPLGVSAADIKMALGVFGEVARVVLKPTGVWQYMVVYFKELDTATAALNHWSILSYFVGFALYTKTAALFGLSEFPSLVAPLAASAADSAVGFRLDSLEKQISDLAVQIEKDIISMKSAAINFANLMVGVSKDIACLRSEVDFSGIDYDDMLAAKPSFLSKNTIEHIIAL